MFEHISSNPFVEFRDLFVHPGNRWFALYLCTSILLAYGVYRYQARHDREMAEEGFLGFAFPREIWAHPSTRLDIAYFVLNKLLFTTLLAATSVVAYATQVWTGGVLVSLAPAPLVSVPVGIGVVLCTLAMILAFDFGLWLAHYLSHRVPLLWEFHKVHHSVEVMTPFAAGRVHPVDDGLSYTISGVLSGLCAALCGWIFGDAALVINAFQAHIVLLVFYLLGFHLRHSHVWLPYTGWLGKVLVSPAHHQVHHSAEERHWDRNMGFIFAIWDWMFGTLWVPAKEKEEFRLGLGGEEREFSSLTRLYTLPFLKAGRRVRSWAGRFRAVREVEAPDGPGRPSPAP